jgi:hypothetical protein
MTVKLPGREFTIYIHLVWRLRMSGCIPPLLHAFWRRRGKQFCFHLSVRIQVLWDVAMCRWICVSTEINAFETSGTAGPLKMKARLTFCCPETLHHTSDEPSAAPDVRSAGKQHAKPNVVITLKTTMWKLH